MIRGRVAALTLIVLAGCGSSTLEPTDTAGTVVVAPPTTAELGFATAVDIVSPAEVAASAVRVTTTTTTPPCNPDGLYCMPFAPDGLDACAEMNFYRIQAGLPDRWSDWPRDGPKRQQGIGWRESNCRNDVTSSTSCCHGYFQIAIANRSAPGYAAAGVFSSCGVARTADFKGNTPSAKQRQACVAANLYRYHTERGEDAAYVVWDQWL